MGYRAVVFDLDGTLLYTLEDLWLATNHALATFGFPARGLDEVRSYVGNGYRRLIRLATPDGTPDAVQEEALATFNAYYLEHCEDNTAPYPGVPELLKRLAAEEVAMAVVSNKGDAATKSLMERTFPGTFAAAVGEREGVHRKPAPDTVHEVLSELGLSPQDIVYVGDSEVDVATAANVGCDFIGVTWGYRSVQQLLDAGATTMVDTTAELEDMLCGRR